MNSIRVWEASYGAEHGHGQRRALGALGKAHRQDPAAFPAEHVSRTREELRASWCGQLREKRRRLLLQLSTDSPTKQDLRFLAWAPDASGEASWRCPSTWDLDDATADYQTTIVPRQERTITYQIMNALHGKGSAPSKAGEAA